jgi:erythromycin esterase-like protein
MARYLVEDLGFRTIAWEEGWGSGVAIDRYVTSGHGDPTAIVGDALFMLRTEAMLELVGWMREFNRGRPDHDKVRFLGADVLELRPTSARSSPTPERCTTWSAPSPLVPRWSAAPTRSSTRTPCSASTRPTAPAETRTTSATGTSPRSSTAGGSTPGTASSTGGEVRPGGPAVYDVPPPDVSLVDHVLGRAGDRDYFIDLHHHGRPAVRSWLRGTAKMRIIGSAYYPANDVKYAITVDPWGGAFDAILHLNQVTPSRLLADR